MLPRSERAVGFPRGRLLRRTWTRTTVAGLSAGAALLVGEVALRLHPPPVPLPRPDVYPGERPDRANGNFVIDPSTGWRMRPGHTFRWTIEGERDAYQADSEGYRVPIGRRARRDRPLRIVLTGDSFAFGVGVEYEETFGALLEEACERVSTRNMAMPGFGLDQMWMTVRHAALPTRPDLILVAFVDPDLDRSLTAYRRDQGFNKPTFRLEAGRLRRLTSADRPTLLGRRLAELHLVRLADHAFRRASRRWPLGRFWSRNAAILRAIRSDASAAGTRLLFVRLPVRPFSEFPLLARFMDEEGAEYLDLGRCPEGLHFEYDKHMNEAGHRWVADAVAAWLAGQGLCSGIGQEPH